MPRKRVSKWRCEPVERPVFPPRAMGSPAFTVNRLQSVVVTDHYVFAIAPTALILHDADFSAESSPNGIAHIDLDVKSIVCPAPSGTIAEHISDACMLGRHAKFCQVERIFFRNHRILVSLHVLVVPIRLQIQGRVQSLFGTDLLLQCQ